jgi:hypothetical protein
MKRSTARKLFAIATFITGSIAAYLMYRRGESPAAIAKSALLNPIGSFASEVHTAAVGKADA